MRVASFEIEAIQPLRYLDERDMMGATIVIRMPAAQAGTFDKISIQVSLDPDDNASLATLSERARVRTAEVLRAAADDVERTDLGTLEALRHWDLE